jgi:hypothetical protein
MNLRKIIIVILYFTLAFTSCKISYSFSGASISPDVKTFSVASFVNTAESFQPTLANELTNGLKDKIQSLSSLQLVNSSGDVQFSGQITGYNIAPISIQGNDLAASNRLTVTINVIFTNTKDPEQDFEQTFSRYADFESSKELSTVEGVLIEEVVEQLTEDIFNKAFVNW